VGPLAADTAAEEACDDGANQGCQDDQQIEFFHRFVSKFVCSTIDALSFIRTVKNQ
jgi:hypothetical protein